MSAQDTLQEVAGEDAAPRLGPAAVNRRWRNPMAVAGLVALLAGGALAGGVGQSMSSAPVGTPRVGAEVAVSATDLYERVASNSPQVVADPTDGRFMAMANRMDAPFDCALQVSGDRGAGWVTSVPIATLPEGAERCYAPEVAFDRHGRLYFLFLGLAGPGNTPVGAYLVHSDDRGRTFSTPVKVLDRQRYQVRMAIDPSLGRQGRIHLVWLQPGSDPALGGLPSGANPIMAAYSDDAGETFSTPVQVSDPGRQRVVAPALALGRDHAVHVIYYDLQDDARDYLGLAGPTWDGNWALVSSSSTDGGVHFGAGAVVDADIVPPERVMLMYTMPPPSLAVDRSGRVFAAWHDARNGDWDVFLRRSTDSGRSWDPPVRLNDDAVEGGSHQYLPRLATSPDGRVDAIFYDRRNNPENRGNDVYYTYSTDGGRTFAANQRITSRFFDSLVGPEYAVTSAEGLVEFGGRLALWSDRHRAFAAWTDTRNTILAPPAQDIFGATVSFRSPAGLGGVARRMGVALALLGGMVLALAVARPSWLRRSPNTEVAP